MELIISGRHLDIDEAVKSHTEERVQRLQKEYPKLTSARVVVELERSWCVAEVHLSGKHLCLDGKAKSRHIATAIDGAMEKVEKQLRKHVDRKQSHRVNKHQVPTELTPAEELAEIESEQGAERLLDSDQPN